MKDRQYILKDLSKENTEVLILKSILDLPIEDGYSNLEDIKQSLSLTTEHLDKLVGVLEGKEFVKQEITNNYYTQVNNYNTQNITNTNVFDTVINNEFEYKPKPDFKPIDKPEIKPNHKPEHKPSIKPDHKPIISPNHPPIIINPPCKPKPDGCDTNYDFILNLIKEYYGNKCFWLKGYCPCHDNCDGVKCPIYKKCLKERKIPSMNRMIERLNKLWGTGLTIRQIIESLELENYYRRKYFGYFGEKIIKRNVKFL